jgi:hypothetical protein
MHIEEWSCGASVIHRFLKPYRNPKEQSDTHSCIWKPYHASNEHGGFLASSGAERSNMLFHLQTRFVESDKGPNSCDTLKISDRYSSKRSSCEFDYHFYLTFYLSPNDCTLPYFLAPLYEDTNLARLQRVFKLFQIYHFGTRSWLGVLSSKHG